MRFAARAHIVKRYDRTVSQARTRRVDYATLAEWRYQLRRLIGRRETAARTAGVEPQQYVLLLQIKGLEARGAVTIGMLAERLQIRHHSAVELVDRLEQRGLVRRTRSKEDRRQVLVSLLPRGEKLLERVVRQRIGELRASGRELVKAIDALLRDGRTRNGDGRLQSASSGEGSRSRSKKIRSA